MDIEKLVKIASQIEETLLEEAALLLESKEDISDKEACAAAKVWDKIGAYMQLCRLDSSYDHSLKLNKAMLDISQKYGHLDSFNKNRSYLKK